MGFKKKFFAIVSKAPTLEKEVADIYLYPLNKIQRRCLSVCLFVCLFVSRKSQERMDGFQKFFLLCVGILNSSSC